MKTGPIVHPSVTHRPDGRDIRRLSSRPGVTPSPCRLRRRATMKIAAEALMRILIVSDIHANWPALSAVRESCDVCLFLGDLVDYGTEPVPCIDWVRRNAHHSIRGNHDHGAADGVVVTGGAGLQYLTGVRRPLP